MDSVLPQMLNERRIFEASSAVSDPGWIQQAKRFPNAFRPKRFTGMSCTKQVVVPCIFVCLDVRC